MNCVEVSATSKLNVPIKTSASPIGLENVPSKPDKSIVPDWGSFGKTVHPEIFGTEPAYVALSPS